MQRVIPERVFDVGQQQFLVLLFMIQAKNDAGSRLFRNVARGEILHRSIHVMPIGKDLLRRRPRKRRPQLLLRLR